MNKADLINEVATSAGISKIAAARVIDSFIYAVVQTVSQRETLRITGFGTFSASERSSRAGQNPATGEKITIKAVTVPKFSAGSLFRAAVLDKQPLADVHLGRDHG